MELLGSDEDLPEGNIYLLLLATPFRVSKARLQYYLGRPRYTF